MPSKMMSSSDNDVIDGSLGDDRLYGGRQLGSITRLLASPTGFILCRPIPIGIINQLHAGRVTSCNVLILPAVNHIL